MSASEDIARYLQANGFGTLEVNLFIDDYASHPDDLLCVTEYGGSEPRYAMEANTVKLERPRVQVLSRANLHLTCRTNIDAVYNFLKQLSHVTMNGVRYMNVAPVSQPFLLTRDSNMRWIFIFNAELERG